MANELGEIAVNVKEQGTDSALEDVADSSADSGDGGGAGGLGGGGQASGAGVGGLLKGISTKLLAIIGFVAFLATLKPIQELLSGIQRLFSVAILPLVSLLMTFLKPILQKILRFVANLDFDNLLTDLTNKLSRIISDAVDAFTQDISNAFDPDVGSMTGDFIYSLQPENRKERVREGKSRRGAFGSIVEKGSIQEQIQIELGWLDEQSNTSLDSGIAETSNQETTNSGPGGQ